MKQLLIVVMALSLFTACKDNKNVNPRDNRESNDRNREDDYNDRDNNDRNRDRNNPDDRNVDYNDNNDRPDNRDDNYNDDRNNDNYSPGGGWSQANVNEFVSNCVSSAANGGMQRSTAQTYCDCMQRHIEKMYPNAEDAGKLSNADLETPAMKRKIQECLGQ